MPGRSSGGILFLRASPRRQGARSTSRHDLRCPWTSLDLDDAVLQLTVGFHPSIVSLLLVRRTEQHRIDRVPEKREGVSILNQTPCFADVAERCIGNKFTV
jgi:hypothetical protein